jgi:hypothetical protein
MDSPRSRKSKLQMSALTCTACTTQRMKRAVCLKCHNQMVTSLGSKIRELQGEVLGQTATSNLLKVIAQECVHAAKKAA